MFAFNPDRARCCSAEFTERFMPPLDVAHARQMAAPIATDPLASLRAHGLHLFKQSTISTAGDSTWLYFPVVAFTIKRTPAQ
jgi:hypothetical protein